MAIKELVCPNDLIKQRSADNPWAPYGDLAVRYLEAVKAGDNATADAMLSALRGLADVDPRRSEWNEINMPPRP